jgi:hypothetical protein
VWIKLPNDLSGESVKSVLERIRQVAEREKAKDAK